jgi:hypothetical protein
MKKTILASTLMAATMAAGNAHAVLWSIQYSGIDTVYDGDRFYSALGIPVSAGGPGELTNVNRATLSDATLNGDQSFGDWAEGTDILAGGVNQLDILKDGVFYDTLSGVRADFRIVLDAGESIDFTQPVGTYNVDEARSFFDIFMDQDVSDCTPADNFACTTGAWGIALDTDTAIDQILLNFEANSTGAFLTGVLFSDNPGTFDLPDFTDNGLPFGSIISDTDDRFTFNLSTTIVAQSGNLADGVFTGVSSGEASFSATQVLEPDALMLMGLGLLGLGFTRRFI